MHISRLKERVIVPFLAAVLVCLINLPFLFPDVWCTSGTPLNSKAPSGNPKDVFLWSTEKVNEVMKRLFDYLDEDGSGKLEKDELYKWSTKLMWSNTKFDLLQFGGMPLQNGETDSLVSWNTLINSQLGKSTDKTDMEKIISKITPTKGGLFSVDAFVARYVSVCFYKHKKQNARIIMEGFNRNEDGLLGPSDIPAFIPPGGTNKFDKFDKNGDGYLDEKELLQLCIHPHMLKYFLFLNEFLQHDNEGISRKSWDDESSMIFKSPITKLANIFMFPEHYNLTDIIQFTEPSVDIKTEL